MESSRGPAIALIHEVCFQDSRYIYPNNTLIVLAEAVPAREAGAAATLAIVRGDQSYRKLRTNYEVPSTDPWLIGRLAEGSTTVG